MRILGALRARTFYSHVDTLAQNQVSSTLAHRCSGA